MGILFYFNTGLCLAVLLIPSVLNLFNREKVTLHNRMAVLGFVTGAVICVDAVYQLGFASLTGLFLGVFAFFCWLSAYLYLSFLIDLTSTRRPGYFPYTYILPVGMAVLTAVVPRPYGIIALVLIGVLIAGVFAVFFMITWIRSATDDRARRDGEWMLMVFFAFTFGLVVCFLQALTGIYWLLAIWYLVTHIAVNHLKIFRQLTELESQLIIDNIFDVVMILNASGHISRLNRRGYQLTGFSSSGVNGYGIEKLLVHSDLYAHTRQDWLDRYSWQDTGLNAGRSPSIDAFISTAAGEEIPIDLKVIRLIDLGKKVSGYILSATDMRITHQLMKEISDREYAARDLVLSESKFSRMFIFNPTGILIIDLDTLRITDANPAIEEILECESSSLPGKTLRDIGLEMDDMPYETFIEKIQMEGSVAQFGARIRLGPKKILKCQLSAVSYNLNRTRSMLLSVSDVTQQENMRDALSRKQKVETIGILAGGIAHDFNNILAVILGHVGLAKMRVSDPHARVPIEKAEQACLRAREMTRQLLAFSRGGKPVMVLCDIRQIIMDSAMITVNDTSIACLFNIDKDIWPVRADKIQIGQVIANLVGNAVEAMDRSGIIEIYGRNRSFSNISLLKRPLDLESKPLTGENYIEIRVHDQGPGIPEAIRAKIFDPFFTTKEKGTGLGLSIVFSVIQNHAGAILVESVKDEGTTFVIYLPAEPDSVRPAPDVSTALLTGNKKVLLMDDDPLVRESAGSMLSSFGYEVTSAADGKEAVDTYREAILTGSRFDFTILDLVVPGGMSGIDCARGILAMDADALLLVSSGYSDDPVLAHYHDYGFTGIIPKPYTRDELGQALANVLVL